MEANLPDSVLAHVHEVSLVLRVFMRSLFPLPDLRVKVDLDYSYPLALEKFKRLLDKHILHKALRSDASRCDDLSWPSGRWEWR